MTLDEALVSLVKIGGSDLHLKANRPLLIRHDGDILPVKMPALSSEEVGAMVASLLSHSQQERLERERELDFSYQLEGVARFRGNAFFQKGVLGATFKFIPQVIPTLDSLSMPPVLKELIRSTQGIILVTGPTGCGKTTTLTAMINEINQHEFKHVLTIEDPIEFVHQDLNCVINQREIGSDTLTFASALRRALRQDPDVILVGEMRDPETIEIAMTAAETGHLVLSTLHTIDAKQSVERIINSFAPEEQHQVRMKLAYCLVAVISQRLVKKSDGSGRMAAQEIMVNSPSVRKLIESGKIGNIDKTIEDSTSYYHMQSLNQRLFELWKSKLLSEEDAISASNNSADLRMKMRATSFAGPAEAKV